MELAEPEMQAHTRFFTNKGEGYAIANGRFNGGKSNVQRFCPSEKCA